MDLLTDSTKGSIAASIRVQRQVYLTE